MTSGGAKAAVAPDLAALQHSLARVFTDASLRSRVFANCERSEDSTLAEPHAALPLRPFSPREVERFSETLIRKRLSAARKLLPLSHAALDAVFDRLFSAYAAGTRLDAKNAYARDAERFVSFCLRRPGGDLNERVRDLMRYEAAWVAMLRPGACQRILVTRFAVHRVRHATLADLTSATLQRPCLYVWWRLRPADRPRWLLWRLPVFHRARRVENSRAAIGQA